MKRPIELHQGARESLAIWEALRRLEFPAEDIYFTLQDGKAGVVLKQNDHEALIGTGVRCEETAEEWAGIMKEAGESWNAWTDGERTSVWTDSSICRRGPMLVLGLLEDGFELSAGDGIVRKKRGE